MRKLMILLYGAFSYLAFLAAFLYAIGFVAGVGVPTSLSSGAAAPLGEAILVNSLLLSLFAVQHSGMARKAFKKFLTRFVPSELERQSYVVATSAVLALMFWQWRPMTDVVWSVESTAGVVGIYTLAAIGWGIVLLATLMINHFDLFGVRQTTLALQGKPYTQLPFQTPGFYKWVRHPLYVGFIIAFWAAPVMTTGHLLFAVMTTGYMLFAAKALEERDLLREHGENYRSYMDRVGGFIPKGSFRPSSEAMAAGD
jgi:protein-S-isoprenylcysteine O-methyltransferase Ste14